MTDKFDEDKYFCEAEGEVPPLSIDSQAREYLENCGIPESDWDGIMKRAQREGIPVGKLKLREMDNDLPGLIGRAQREGKKIEELDLRSGDDVHRIYISLCGLLAKVGFPIKEGFDEDGIPVTRRSFRNPFISDKPDKNDEE